MAKTRVFRIESKADGKCGIYGLQQAGVEPYRYTKRPPSAQDYSEHHANPFFDKGFKSCPFVIPALRLIHPSLHCGFGSIEQMHRWFPPSRLCDMEHEAGHVVRLAEYEVDEELVQRGDKQVLFPIDAAVLVEQHSVHAFSGNCPDPDD